MHKVFQRQGESEQGRDGISGYFRRIQASSLEMNSQELTVNNEMVMEHGRQAVALRDEFTAELQAAVNELSESLVEKDEVIEQENRRIKEQSEQLKAIKGDSGHRATLSSMDFDDLRLQIRQLREMNEAEIAEKEHNLERYEKDLAERKESAYVEKQLQIDREMSLENAMEELKDENVNLIEMNSNLRSRIAEQIRARARGHGDDTNMKVIEDLQDELLQANAETKMLQESIEANPKLTQALLNVEEDEAERWKKMHVIVAKGRDEAVRKNANLYIELQEANRKLASRTASGVAAPATPIPASPSSVPPTSLFPMISLPKAKTPSSTLPSLGAGGTPKAPSVSGGHELSLLPPPAPSTGNGQNVSEVDRLREELRQADAMVLDHFRTTSKAKDEVLFDASHIYKLQYRGDKEIDKFLNAWLETIANMKPEDIPSETTLRDHLLRKIENPQALHVDLTIFKGRDNDDKKKTYKELLEIMKRYIARVREDKNMAARDKFATDYTNLGKPTTPAPKPTAPAPDPKDGKTGKPSAPAPKGR